MAPLCVRQLRRKSVEGRGARMQGVVFGVYCLIHQLALVAFSAAGLSFLEKSVRNKQSLSKHHPGSIKLWWKLRLQLRSAVQTSSFPGNFLVKMQKE